MKLGLACLCIALLCPMAAQAKMARPGLKNAKLEKEMSARMAEKWRKDKILKVVIVDKKWAVEKAKIGGKLVPQRRTIRTEVASQQGTTCRIFEVTFEQQAVSKSGFGPTAYYSVGGNREIDCSAIK